VSHLYWHRGILLGVGTVTQFEEEDLPKGLRDREEEVIVCFDKLGIRPGLFLECSERSDAIPC